MEENQYISLANKYRPQNFEDMVGQESISKTLQNALKQNRVAHAYLFYGPRGCGKTTTARILAKALNCTGDGHDKPTATPCGKCPQCVEIARNEDMDVMELDAASNTGVDNVREAIIDTVSLAAGRDRFKVFILDEVHMLSDSAFNALLKTIEEPPAHVVFILATTEKNKVPATIVSRCQTFRFRPLTVEEISSHLVDLAEAEGLDLTEDAAKLIAKNAGGAMRDALTLLDRAVAYGGKHLNEKTVSEMLGLTPNELLTEALDGLVHKNGEKIRHAFATLEAEGYDPNSFLKDLKNVLNDSFYFKLGYGAEPLGGVQKVLADISAGLLAQLSRKVTKLAEEVKFADNALISAEIGLFTVMDSVLDVDGFIRRLEALEKGTPVSTVPPSASGNQTAQTPLPHKTAPARVATVSKTSKTTTPSTPLSDQQVWDQLLRDFRKTPFVYEVLAVSQIQFSSPDKWTIVIPSTHEFYRVPMQGRLAELSATASRLSGRTVDLVLEVQTKAPSVDPAPTTAAPKTAKSSASKAKKIEISDEEPFVETKPAAAQTSAKPATRKTAEKVVPAGQAPEEVKGILEMFSGDLVTDD